MKVVTLHEDTFLEHCRQLEETCSEFAPDLIIGIATGGSIVARNMFVSLPHIEVRSCRPSTKAKQQIGLLFKLIRMLPEWMRNLLRILESYSLSKKDPAATVPSIGYDDAPHIKDYHRILIIDDAVDSGATMSAVNSAIRKIAPDSAIRTAVMTVTTRSSIIKPDYTIYNQNVLLRFPWSKDYKP